MVEGEQRKNANSSQPQLADLHTRNLCNSTACIQDSFFAISNDIIVIAFSLGRGISVTKGYFGFLDSAHKCIEVDTRQAHACLLARRLVCDGPVKLSI